MLVLVALVGIYIMRAAYHAEHQSSPTEAADSFFQAVFYKRDIQFAEDYMCEGNKIKHRTSLLIEEINEKDTGSGDGALSYNWSQVHATSKSGNYATVTATIEASVSRSGGDLVANPTLWTLNLRNQSGWKVCDYTIDQ